MTLEDLLEALRALRPLPLTAYVAVRIRADETGARINRVSYEYGEVVIDLDVEEEEEEEEREPTITPSRVIVFRAKRAEPRGEV